MYPASQNMDIALTCTESHEAGLHTERNMDNHSPNRQVSTKKSHNRVAAGVIGWPRRTRLHSVQNEIRGFPTCLSARSERTRATGPELFCAQSDGTMAAPLAWIAATTIDRDLSLFS